jgi:type II secretory pathway component PulF
MLKIRIIAVLIAIVLTLLTIYLVPRVVFMYTHFASGLSQDQKVWFNGGQALLGAVLAGYSFWCWKKKKS